MAAPCEWLPRKATKPARRRITPIPARGTLWPGMAVDEPSRLNLPVRGPTK